MSRLKIVLHDYAGHPFQAQLSRAFAARGHDVVHSYCAAYASGKGRLVAEPGEPLRFEPIGVGSTIAKMDFKRRLIQEIKLGFELIGLIRRERPDVVVVANVPIPTLTVMAAVLLVLRIPWVLWHQDVQAVAIRGFAGEKISKVFALLADGIEAAEKWCARRAAAIVVISDGFLGVHRQWRTAGKCVVIPNWAPLDEIEPRERDNAWATEHGLGERGRILYSGTLGLKHNPALLPGLARAAADCGADVDLVVVNEGPAQEIIRDESARLGVNLTALPFQPYEVLPDVLGAGDVLVVLLEKDAGVFSVPSKTLSYLCAGRPVLALMPEENLAAASVLAGGGLVLEPSEASLPKAGQWVADLLKDRDRARAVGEQARALAESEFEIQACADRFEAVLIGAVER